MNCQEFESVVNDLAREQMMEATDRAEAIDHSEGCRACACRLEDERELTGALREYSDAIRAETISSLIEIGLIAEFQKKRASVGALSQTVVRSYWWPALAAAVVLAFVSVAVSWSGLLTASDHPPQAVRPTMGQVVKREVPNHKDNQAATDTQAPSVTVAAKPVRKRKPTSKPEAPSMNNQETIAANFNAEEVTTDFILIGFGNSVNVQDGGQLVRVEMPRSAMARFGVPVNMERFDERVKADVLVGVDGLARAIRFVQ